MKKLLYISIALISLGFYSCNDFLDEESRSKKDGSKPYTSPADARAGVNYLYTVGYTAWWTGGAYDANHIYKDMYMTGMYDNVSYTGMNVFIGGALGLSLDSGVHNSDLFSTWSEAYRAITRGANTALKNLPTCPGFLGAAAEKERAQLIAEARFFRALNYFWLVKHFGAVPIMTEPIDNLDDPNMFPVPSTEKAVYTFIYNELLDALNNGELEDKPMHRNGMRVSKGSVLALLTDVCLNMAGYPVLDASKYAEASKYADMLITSSNYSLIQSADKGTYSVYNLLRTTDNQDEYLYQIEFLENIRNAGRYSTWCFPAEFQKKAELKFDIANDNITPVAEYLSVYDKTDDLRYQDGQYFHTSFVTPSGATVDLSEGSTVKRKYPFFFYNDNATKTTDDGKDRVVYRLAEMYLAYAEAEVMAKGSVTQTAADRLAAIQARASVSGKTAASISASLMRLSKDAFVKEVWKERTRELIFDPHKAWYDITRTRMYPKIDASTTNTTYDYVNLIGATSKIKGAKFTEKNIYYPYPNSELQRNPNLSSTPKD